MLAYAVAKLTEVNMTLWLNFSEILYTYLVICNALIKGLAIYSLFNKGIVHKSNINSLINLRSIILSWYRGRYGIKSLFQAGVFRDYSNNEIKPFLKEKIQPYVKWKDDQIKVQYITSLEKADDFFVHKLSFEKVCNQSLSFCLLNALIVFMCVIY